MKAEEDVEEEINGYSNNHNGNPILNDMID